MQLICVGCGAALTDEERHYYETNCETCEREDLDRWQDWRRGAPDLELDAKFDAFEKPAVN